MPIEVNHLPSFAGYGQATYDAAQGMEDWTRLQELMATYAPMAQENYQFSETQSLEEEKLALQEELEKMQLAIEQQQADQAALQAEWQSQLATLQQYQDNPTSFLNYFGQETGASTNYLPYSEYDPYSFMNFNSY